MSPGCFPRCKRSVSYAAGHSRPTRPIRSYRYISFSFLHPPSKGVGKTNAYLSSVEHRRGNEDTRSAQRQEKERVDRRRKIVQGAKQMYEWSGDRQLREKITRRILEVSHPTVATKETDEEGSFKTLGKSEEREGSEDKMGG
ncbi:uncharacterized protein BDV17DRAFT_239797 [Aspergillus undulatus]|uniref:uncharacterized protein n=1 Tax=Aspergillus undulatus TaxID=1810928 RepID=UPI003CCD02A3